MKTIRRQQGLTIIESLVSIAVAAVVTTSVVPQLESMRHAKALSGAAAQVETDLQFARSEAIARNRTLRMTIAADATGSCMVLHTGGSEDCRCDGGVPACTAAVEILRSHTLGAADRVQLSANVGSIVFDPARGTNTPTATIRLVAGDGRALHQIVNLMGRTRSCSPDGRTIGYKAC